MDKNLRYNMFAWRMKNLNALNDICRHINGKQCISRVKNADFDALKYIFIH